MLATARLVVAAHRPWAEMAFLGLAGLAERDTMFQVLFRVVRCSRVLAVGEADHLAPGLVARQSVGQGLQMRLAEQRRQTQHQAAVAAVAAVAHTAAAAVVQGFVI